MMVVVLLRWLDMVLSVLQLMEGRESVEVQLLMDVIHLFVAVHL